MLHKNYKSNFARSYLAIASAISFPMLSLLDGKRSCFKVAWNLRLDAVFSIVVEDCSFLNSNSNTGPPPDCCDVGREI